MKKILYNRQSPELEKIRTLIEKQNHRTLVLWVIDCAPKVLAIFEKKYQDDLRPRRALEATILWSKGEIKMPEARRAALASHQAAADVSHDLAACAAAHAMGHVLGTVHVETHAMGLLMYGLTAFARQADDAMKDEIVSQEINWFYERLSYWELTEHQINRAWASFLLKNNVPNKEKQLREKEMMKKYNSRKVQS